MAGLVHLTAHSLAKAAAFQTGSGRAARWIAIAAVAGLPPFGLFGSLVLILQQTIRHGLWLAMLLGAGIAVGAWAMMMRLPAPDGAVIPGWSASCGAWACLAGALLLGLAMPGPLVDWFQAMAAAAQ